MDDKVIEVAKLTPPATVTTLSLLGISLADWVYIFTLIYLILQIFFLIKKQVRGKQHAKSHTGRTETDRDRQ
jgi:hypothetical protein